MMLHLVADTPEGRRPSKDAPELAAFIRVARFLHEQEPVAFYCIARLIQNTAADRGGPTRDLRTLRAFIAEWED